MQYYNSKTIIYADGEFKKASEAGTDLYGQSLHYGYGVFEGIRSYKTHNGVRIFKAKEHYERLKRSCERMQIPFKWDVQELSRITYALLEKNNFRDAYIRPLVYCPPSMSLTVPTESSLMICAWEWGALLGNQEIRVCISSFQRPNPKSTWVEAKVTGHYVNSILASTEARNRGFDEALLLDQNQHVAEGPGANIFIEKDGKLFTPALGNILPGITRATVIELCKILEIQVEEKSISVEELMQADSAFFCGTAVEVVGIGSIDDKQFPLKWPDSLGSTIQQAYRNLVIEKVSYEVII